MGDPTEISAREAEVLGAVGEHLTNAEIASRLYISVRTVESHVSSLLRKLGAAHRRDLARVAATVAGPRTASAGRLTGVPVSRTTFVGRSRERGVIQDRMARARLLTLLGPGGVGKTRLAAVVAETAAADYPDGGTFVDLVAVGPGQFVPALAGAMGVVERPPRSLADAVLERLAAARLLMVLDNCEHLVGEVGPMVERVLSRCPDVTILATSRQRLGVTGEHLVVVAPLPVGSDAEQLFLDRALAVSSDFAADPSVVTRICASLDGVPLAIELAAARSASLGAEGLLAALDDHLLLLTGGRQTDRRHRSLQTVIRWSYDLLDEEERDMFRRLSVFVGGFDLDAAQVVAPGASRGEVADLVGRLVDRSLIVHRQGDAGRSRWRMLDTIRAFGVQQLAKLGAEDDVRQRHQGWAATTAAALERTIPRGWEAAFDEVADDLRAALAATGPAPDRTAHGLARSLAHLTFARRNFVEARGHYQRAADRAGDPVEAARDLRDAADAAVIVSHGPAAFALLVDAAARAGTGNARAGALARAVIVSVRYAAEFHDQMTHVDRSELLREAVAAADGTDPATDALLAAARAWHQLVSEPTVSMSLPRAAVRAARRTADPALIAASLDVLGTAATQAGRIARAHRIADVRLRVVSSLAVHEPAGAAEVTDAHHVAVSAALAAGDLPAARAAVHRADADDPARDHPYLTIPRLVRLSTLSGQFDEATSAAEALWDNWVRDGEPPMAWMSSALAAGTLVHGLRDDGRYDLWRSRALAVAGHDNPTASPDLMAIIAFVEARIAIHHGYLDRAGALVQRAWAVFPERWWEGYARSAGAELAVVAGLPGRVERLARLEPLASEHRWAAACLTRARGRLTGDPETLEDALAQWNRLGARFERACTLLLLPDRESEGRAELTALGCPTGR